MALRSCLVSCRDQAGDAYAVQVTAESLYEALAAPSKPGLRSSRLTTIRKRSRGFPSAARIHPPAGAGGWRWPSAVRNEMT